ncbi:MAG TPA: T9SS type A sorting domain-containing protein, partial [Chitinophagales bacterium]|nr:T9SS type A sorting domain-containing protein [Chitinophagales bacterium]
MKTILLPFIAFLASFSSYATHIIGGEMSYPYLGNDVYHITLKVYRDCLNGQATLDDPAFIAVFDANNNMAQYLHAPLLQIDTIPVSLGCSSVPLNICAEQGIYEIDVTLPPSTGGYTMLYQRCCRSGIIGNLAIPLEEGMTFIATIPDPSLATGNSSPVFNNYPPTAFCVGIPIYFNHEATDADGDSLVYEFCNGIAGASQMSPYPNPPNPPPYPEVTYLSPYSGAYPFNSDPALAINSSTGLVSGTPSSIGVFTLAVMVKEYRNGNLIGEHRREMAEVYTVAGMPSGISNASENSQVIIYPVPSSNELNIIPSLKDKIKEVKVFDLTGRL